IHSFRNGPQSGSRSNPRTLVEQISPDKDVDFRYIRLRRTAFTISPEPRASSCCLPVRSHADRC
ncbi:MAG: hypothetical protein Q8O04_03590, partial [Deltaproteobacteria bacterium]|nr:hypothetical protein [Deltaproteobacteria bacterium]